MGGFEGEKGRGNDVITLLSRTKQKLQTQRNSPTKQNKTKTIPRTKQNSPCRQRQEEAVQQEGRGFEEGDGARRGIEYKQNHNETHYYV